MPQTSIASQLLPLLHSMGPLTHVTFQPPETNTLFLPHAGRTVKEQRACSLAFHTLPVAHTAWLRLSASRMVDVDNLSPGGTLSAVAWNAPFT